MAKFRIYSKDGQAVRYEGCPKYNGTYLKVSYLEFPSVSSPVPIDWHVGDYVDYPRTGLRYTLRIIPSVDKRAKPGQSGNGFEYRNVKFMAQTQDLEVAPFVDLVPGDNGVHFSTQSDVSTYENAYGIAARIQACLDDLFPDRWDVRVYEGIDEDFKAKISEAVDFSIDGASCLSACDRMYETWGIGWTHYKDSSSGKDVLLFGRPNTRTADNTTDEFIFGPGNGLTAIRRSVANADELGTRLRVFGSMRNMLSDYYNGLDIYSAESVDIRNLMIPPSKWGQTEGKPDARKAYLQASGDVVEELGLIPRTHYFDGSDGEEIFPTLEGMTVGEIRSAKAEMQDTEHVPSETVYPDDSERVDEVKAVTNPTDDGYSGKSDGSKYKDSQIVSFAGLNSDPVSTLYDVTRRYTIFSNVAFPDNGLTVTVDSGMEGYINDADDFIRSLSIKLRLVTDEDDAHQLVSEVEVPFSPSDLSGTRYDFVLPSISLTRRNGSSVSLYLDLIAGVRPPSSQTNVRTFYVNLSGYSFVLGTSSPVSSDFQLTLKQIGFNLQDRASLTGEGLARVFMKDGMNAGRSFYVQSCTYEAEGDQWRLGMYRAEDESTGMRYPNTQFPIAAGDHFVLLDIAMPELYVGTAQQRLYEKGLEMLNDISRVKPYYEPEVDAKVMVEQSRTLREGMYMKLTDADLAGAESKYVLIDTLTINEGDKAIPTYRVSLREYRKKSFQETTDAAIDSAMKKVSGSSIDKPSSSPSTSVSYDGLTDKPSIDGTVLEGNKRSYDDLGLINKNFFELVNIGTETSPEYAIRAKYGLFSDYFISAHGSDPEAEAAAGLDIDELWSVLGASGTEKINVSHIPALGISAITGLQDALDSKLEGVTKGMVEAVLTGTVTSHDHDGRYAPLSGGLIPSQYLPGFVDDVLEYPSAASFPDAGESGKIYVALDTNLAYRWGGSGYVEISPSLALGHTSSTAYPGDEGAANAAAIRTLQGRFTGGAANKVAHSLTIVHDGGSTSASDKTFDGSAAVTVSIPTTLPASDVYAWAKASTKPSYTWGEIGGKPSVFTPAAHKHVKADITDFPTSWAWSAITGRPTTLAGYGITDGVNKAEAGGHLTASVSGHSLSVGVASGYALPSSTQITLWNKIASLFDIDADGNVYVTGDRGFYSNSFVSARGSDPEAGSGAGGLDVDELWSILGASGTEKIDASHIPALNISKITGLQSALDGKLNNGSTTYDTAYARNLKINGITYGIWAPANPAALGPFYIPTSAGTSGYILQSTGGVPGWISRAALTQQLFSGGKGCVAIPENSDLNDYTTPGLYYYPANATVKTLANVPVTGAFSLEILQAAGVIQILREYGYSSNANEYTRRYYNGSWTTWVRAPRLNELYTKTEADGRYLKLAGGTMTGDIIIPSARATASSPTVPAAMTFDSIESLTDVENYRSFLGSANVGGTWYSVISVRHRNGNSDGNEHGIYLTSRLGLTGGLTLRKQYNGDWGDVLTLLDSSNYTSYAVSLTGAQTISGAKTFTSQNGETPFVISRGGDKKESVSISVNDTVTRFDVVNDETFANLLFSLSATDTEAGGGAAAKTGYVNDILASDTIYTRYGYGASQRFRIGWNPNDGAYIENFTAGKWLSITDTGSLLYNSDKIWHSGNDGSGSGLDADLLDGKHLDDVGKWIFSPGQKNPSNRLPDAADLNDYIHTKAGWWTTKDNTTYGNAPYTNFGMLVATLNGSYPGQLLLPYNSDAYNLQYRAKRYTSGWSAWKKLAYTTDNVASATKLATARTLWGKSFDGTGNVSGDMTDVGLINGALQIEEGDDISYIKTTNHKTEFCGYGYVNKVYYFRPGYSSLGKSTANVYIQNASASTSPAFTTTHAFKNNGNATHSGALTAGSSIAAGGHLFLKASYARLIFNSSGSGFMMSMENGNFRLMSHNTGGFVARLAEVDMSGNVGIKAAPASGYALNVAGAGYFGGLLCANAGVQIGGTADIGWYKSGSRLAAGASVARGVNVGDLLVSNAWADMTKVPTNGIYSKGAVLTDSYLQVGSGRLRWDAANNALYVEKSDGTACGLYATGFLSSHDVDPGAGTAAGADTGAAVPQYDLLRPRRLASQTCYEGSVTDTTVSPNRVLTVSDQPPMLRFRGGKPGDGWSVEVYVRTSGGKNSKYRRVLTAPISECTADSSWKNTVYESVVLPWSLMRIFFEKFDPTAGRFHSTPYVGATVGAAWANLVANSRKGSGVTSFTSIEKKRWYSPGGDGGSIRSQASCLYAYAHFGVRLANDTLGVHGDMKTFTISLRKATSSNLRNNDLSFTMRTD